MANDDIARPHVWRPAGNPGEARTLLLLHGTGADEYDLLNLGKALDPHANLLSPRGMYLESGMNRFFERYPDGTFNEVSIAENTDELARFLAAAVSHYGFRADQVWAAGFSNGANAAAALLMLHPASLRGIVSFWNHPSVRQPGYQALRRAPAAGKVCDHREWQARPLCTDCGHRADGKGIWGLGGRSAALGASRWSQH